MFVTAEMAARQGGGIFHICPCRVEREGPTHEHFSRVSYVPTSRSGCLRMSISNPRRWQADACAPGSSEAAQSFAGERALPYFETSAKDYESVESAMHQILPP